jgi:Zn-dependent M28 family amino/carboxypeptidase
VLLETARVLAKTPMPATIVFAAFTGEEAGLLGSREFVRQAQQKKTRIAGALNNDMIGWANDHRLDNTIRYSNAGIRDLQHAAAFLFSRLITYDSRYFRSTDAAAYYEAYGDIVGGIGSYPVLGNPYYHQPADLLETVNHQLVAETAKATVASIMRLASGPSRVQGLTITRVNGGTAEATWTPSPESGVVRYIVVYGSAAAPQGRRTVVTAPNVRQPGLELREGDTLHVAVKAVSRTGLESWDWARAVAERK